MSKKKSGGKPKSGLTTATTALMGLVFAAVMVVVAILAVIVALIGGATGCFGGSGEGAGSGGPEPSQTALKEIPRPYLRLYREMGQRYGLDWAFLASIGAQESGHGANATRSSSGCIGVMQLCGAFTTRPVAQDGNGDGDIQLEGTDDPADSIASAANGIIELKVKPFGDKHPNSYADYRAIACRYYGACADGSANYADEVMARAVQYGFSGAGAPAPTDPQTGPQDRGPERTLAVVGDSLAVGTSDILPDVMPGWTVTTDAATSRPTADGIRRIEALGDSMPSVLAVSLGTNDDPSATRTFRQQVNRVVAAAGANRCVLWMEIRRPPLNGVSYDAFNSVLRDVARDKPNFVVVNARGELAGDGVHQTPDGYRTRARDIGRAARACIGDLEPSEADALAGSPECASATGGSGSLQGEGSPDAEALATNRNITWAHSLTQLQDLRFGRVSPRMIALLSLIAENHKITVTALASDHSPGSNHEAGRAADIAIVDDDNCYPPDQTGACWALAQDLDRIKGCLHPTELIYYFDPGPTADSFAKSDHDDHIHVGYDGPLGPRNYAPDTPPCSGQALSGGR